MLIDLHCHTTASDGTLSPVELIELAAQRGVDVIAVTDHDTVAGVAEAAEAGLHAGIRVVAGIELSTRAERSCHVLGYFVDPASPALSETLVELREERMDRMRRMVSRLCELGYELTIDEVLAQAHGAIVARPHVARALVERGYIARVSDAFTAALIADGGRADVPRRQPSPAAGIELIRAAGGVAVLAHPGLAHHLGTHDPVSTALIEELVGSGLAGIEVDHPDHPPDVRDRLRALADRLGLVATGGSDFHGETGRILAACVTRAEALSALEERAA